MSATPALSGTAPANPPLPADLQQALAQLRPQHLPDAISWWPPAPGWWLLTVIFIVALILLLRGLKRRRARQRLPRLALAELDDLRKQTLDNVSFATRSQRLLRSFALQTAPKLDNDSDIDPGNSDSPAHLHGITWLAWLDQHAGKRNAQGFDSPLGREWQSLVFSGTSQQPFDQHALAELIEQWLRQQMRKPRNSSQKHQRAADHNAGDHNPGEHNRNHGSDHRREART